MIINDSIHINENTIANITFTKDISLEDNISDQNNRFRNIISSISIDSKPDSKITVKYSKTLSDQEKIEIENSGFIKEIKFK